MEIGLDTNLWMNFAPGKLARGDCAHPDWHGLRARLFAGRAAHRALTGRYEGEVGAPAGSFDGAAAAAVFALRSAGEAVNPSSWGDGKSVTDNDAGVAGPTSTGDRG